MQYSKYIFFTYSIANTPLFLTDFFESIHESGFELKDSMKEFDSGIGFVLSWKPQTIINF